MVSEYTINLGYCEMPTLSFYLSLELVLDSETSFMDHKQIVKSYLTRVLHFPEIMFFNDQLVHHSFVGRRLAEDVFVA